MPSRVVLAFAVTVIAAISAAGLLWSPAGGGTAGRSTAAAAMTEYRQEARSLEARGLVLAPGWRWPVAGVFADSDPDGAPMAWGPGSGAQRADLYWFYSWANRAVTHDLPPEARQAALAQLARVRETTYYQRLIPDTRRQLDAEVATALRGDLARLRADVRANRPAP